MFMGPPKIHVELKLDVNIYIKIKDPGIELNELQIQHI